MQPTNTSRQCLEVAVATVHDAEAFGALQRRAHRDMARLPGFVHSVALRGLEDRSLRADLVVWSDLAAARTVAEQFPHDERFAAFMRSVREIRHFRFYDGACREDLCRVARHRAVEIRAYDVFEPRLAAALADARHHIDGATPELTAVRADDVHGRVDVVGWTDPAAHAIGTEVLERDARESFAGIVAIEVAALFEVEA